jgi:hypothetical protein
MNILSWFFGIGWVFTGLSVGTNGNVVGGVLMILGGLIVAPFTREKANEWLKKNGHTFNINHIKAFGFAIICFFIAGIFFNTTPNKSSSNDQTVQIEQTKKSPVKANENTTKPVKQANWYSHDIQLALGEMKGEHWRSYNSNQRLAISANVLATYWTNKSLTPEIMNSIKSMDHLKPYASELTKGLNGFYGEKGTTDGKGDVTLRQTVAETAPVLIAMMGWSA